MDETGMDAVFGLFFGLFGLIYIGIILFMIVLTVVLIFKIFSFMKSKTINDERLISAIERLEKKLGEEKHDDHSIS